jgi:hypothetical protein
MRIKTPEFKQRQDAGEQARRMVQRIKGVTQVTFTPLTGSLVVLYDTRRTSSDRISGRLRDRGWFNVEEAVSTDDYVKGAVTQAGLRVGKVALSWALGKALEGSGLSLLAAVL